MPPRPDHRGARTSSQPVAAEARLRLVHVAIAAAVVLLAPLTGRAAQVYGTLFKGGRPLAGASVAVACESGDHAEARTDGHGAYRLFVGHTGRCTMSVADHSGARAAIYSFDEPVRFDFAVVPAGSGFKLRKR